MLKLFLALLMSTQLHAHPVIYKDGWVLSSSNMESYSDNQILYSFSQNWATGLNQFRFSKDQKHSDYYFARLNHLAWRYNGHDSQANLYLTGALGAGESGLKKEGQKIAYMTGFEADWETRTLFSALKHYQFHLPGLEDIGMTTARVGFSPYEAPFENLQSWFMLQVMYMPEVNKNLMITPMLRFFYKNVLWEIGSSSRGDWMLNLMVHY